MVLVSQKHLCDSCGKKASAGLNKNNPICNTHSLKSAALSPILIGLKNKTFYCGSAVKKTMFVTIC